MYREVPEPACKRNAISDTIIHISISALRPTLDEFKA